MIVEQADNLPGSKFHDFNSARDMVLSEHVRIAVSMYFSQLNGCTVSDLYELVISEVEKPLFQVVLEHYGNNQSKAANALGISRGTLRKKIAQYKITD